MDLRRVSLLVSWICWLPLHTWPLNVARSTLRDVSYLRQNSRVGGDVQSDPHRCKEALWWLHAPKCGSSFAATVGQCPTSATRTRLERHQVLETADNPNEVVAMFREPSQRLASGYAWMSVQMQQYLEDLRNKSLEWEVPMVNITRIKGKLDLLGGNLGKNFFASRKQWTAMVGATSPAGRTYNVVQIRNGSLVWMGSITSWDDWDGIHGHRSTGASRGQWERGDSLMLADDVLCCGSDWGWGDDDVNIVRDMIRKTVPNRDNDYLHNFHGCYTNMILGRGCMSKYNNTAADISKAIGLVDQFFFVGLTEKWPLSMCLFNYLTTGKRYIDDGQLENMMPTGGGGEANTDTHTTYDTSGFAKDDADEAVYAHVAKRFSDELDRYKISEESCAFKSNGSPRSIPKRTLYEAPHRSQQSRASKDIKLA